jgi:demethylmenaquinone methyltransferase/2-methoxy-6-polyprenyl-1,4-benzoquinol methylase
VDRDHLQLLGVSQTEAVSDDQVLEEQRSFYKARAPEYDEWWQRRGRYDRGEDAAREWERQVAVVDGALAAFGASGDVLELAGGTGWWTQRLATTARRLTVVDASPETLALNQARVSRTDVEYIAADLFDWTPPKSYDVVFFSFWLSHVPRSKFSEFWTLVRSCLGPMGRAFFVDNRNDPSPGENAPDPYVIEYGPDLHLRELSDGSRYRVVKVMYEPDELQSVIEAEGWKAEVGATRWFIFGSARPG